MRLGGIGGRESAVFRDAMLGAIEETREYKRDGVRVCFADSNSSYVIQLQVELEVANLNLKSESE